MTSVNFFLKNCNAWPGDKISLQFQQVEMGISQTQIITRIAADLAFYENFQSIFT